MKNSSIFSVLIFSILCQNATAQDSPSRPSSASQALVTLQNDLNSLGTTSWQSTTAIGSDIFIGDFRDTVSDAQADGASCIVSFKRRWIYNEIKGDMGNVNTIDTQVLDLRQDIGQVNVPPGGGLLDHEKTSPAISTVELTLNKRGKAKFHTMDETQAQQLAEHFRAAVRACRASTKTAVLGDPVWVDPTGLSWAKAMNGDTTPYRDAVTYCSNLHTGGMSNWRLPEYDEMLSLKAFSYDSPTPKDDIGKNPQAFAKGGVQVTHGYYWTSTAKNDFHGKPGFIAYSFEEDSYWIQPEALPPGTENTVFVPRVVCVHGKGDSSLRAAAREANDPDVWTDSATGLVWPRHSSDHITGSWNAAAKFCKKSTAGSMSGWRVPSLDELKALYGPVGVRGGLELVGYTMEAWTAQSHGSDAVTVDLHDGQVGTTIKSLDMVQCICVHDRVGK